MHMIGQLKKHISDTIFKNYILVPRAPLDIRDSVNDPRYFNYTGRKQILLNAKTSFGRCFQLMKLDFESNPIVRALHALDENANPDKNKAIIREAIQHYYSTVQPETIHEWFGLPSSDSVHLKNFAPWTLPEPWINRDIESKRKATSRWLKKDSERYHQDLKTSDGFTFFGPVNEKKIHLETERFFLVYTSIKKNGYIRADCDDGDIGATVFISKKNNEWRWSVSPGQHRAIVLTALNYNTIPVRVKQIVYEDEVEYWPNVHSGLYSADTALHIFNAFFAGKSF